jgi:hypothetical protein
MSPRTHIALSLSGGAFRPFAPHGEVVRGTFGGIRRKLLDLGVSPEDVGRFVESVQRANGEVRNSAKVTVTLTDAVPGVAREIRDFALVSRGWGKSEADVGPNLRPLNEAQAALLTPGNFAYARQLARRKKYSGYVLLLGGEQGADDVIQEALYRRAARFDAAKGVPFRAYLNHPRFGIGGALRDAARRLREQAVAPADLIGETGGRVYGGGRQREASPHQAAVANERREILREALEVRPARVRHRPGRSGPCSTSAAPAK